MISKIAILLLSMLIILISSCNINTCQSYQRLLNNDHSLFESDINHMFNVQHSNLTHCPLQNNCPHFQNLLQGKNHSYTDDLAHFLTKNHPWRNRLDETQNCNLNKLNLNAQCMRVDTRMDRRRIIKPAFSFKFAKECLWHQLEAGFISWRWFGVTAPSNYFRKLTVADLIEEVKRNNFYGEFRAIPLLQRVQNKLRHPRHVRLGSPLNDVNMLAIVMYTDTAGIYKDLRKAEISGNRDKWIVFSTCLYDAIIKLGTARKRLGITLPNKVYSGMRDVIMEFSNLNNNTQKIGSFTIARPTWFNLPTFMSFSSNKQVAKQFRSNSGTIIEISTSNCDVFAADISWISYYGGESEVLFVKYLPLAVIRHHGWRNNVTGQFQQYVEAIVDGGILNVQSDAQEKFKVVKGTWFDDFKEDLKRVAFLVTGTAFI